MGRPTKEEQKRRAELLAKGLKQCFKCGRVLPIEQFSKDKRSKDGLNNICRKCDYEYKRSEKGKLVNAKARAKYNKSAKGKKTNRKRREWEKQGNGFTDIQWGSCLQFFNYECAYSGKPLDGQDVEVEHIVALANGGVHEIWNICPAIAKYNSSKKDKDMLEWYTQQEFYSKERLQRIYEWQQYAYNKWGKQEQNMKIKEI